MEDDRISKDEGILGALDSIQVGCQIIGRDWRYLYLNDAAARHGRSTKEELVGRTMMEMYPGIEKTEMFGLLRTCMDSRTSQWMENEFTYPDGTTGWFELGIQPVPVGIFILSVDITARKRADMALREVEDKLRQSQKLEAVGRLAGGIAHDFNNILAVIMAYADLLLNTVEKADPVHGDIEGIKKAADHAAQLTRQLLAFSRMQPLKPEVLDLNARITHLEGLLRRLIGEDVRFATVLGKGLGRIKADPGQIDQIIMNLAVNARDAMPDGGQLIIETADITLDQDYAQGHPGVTPGPYVMISLSDTGSGMDKDVLSHVFEPFFTTKKKGKGTGLGLSTVYGIVTQSGGNIWVYSEPGKGTTFKIYFPRVEEEPVARGGRGPAKERTKGSETILVVEDEDMLRGLVCRILRQAGHTVLDAKDGAAALEQCGTYNGPIHLVLTDVVMPGMSGRELAGRITKMRPETRVLYMSGYTETSVIRNGMLTTELAFVQKPFSADSLTAKVREVLSVAKSPPL